LTWKRIDSAYEWLIFFKSIQRHGMINNGNRFEFGDKGQELVGELLNTIP